LSVSATRPGTSSAATAEDADWWRQAVVYQIYPRSFADANGDGIGDLIGITSKIPYLSTLGVDALWLSPFYPSALADGGYDVDDYRNVDPSIGTLDEFDVLSATAHAAGLKLIVDIVPNHSSNRHAWFKEALAAGKGSPARNRYIFMDGNGPDSSEPPSDWPASFGGSAWTRVVDGQWYLHLFTREQPDFNWSNREVRDDFLTTFAFWADRGVDGFRIDVAHMLVKDLTLPLPSHVELSGDIPLDGSHRYYDRDDVHEIYAEWRELFNSYDPPRTAVAEAWVPAERRGRYASPEGLGQAFNFDLLKARWDAEEFRSIITKNLAESANSKSSQTWVFSNHDVVRHATRYGLPDGTNLADWLMTDGTKPPLDVATGLRRARAATLLALALPGSTYIYQGEELGLVEVADIPGDALQDPTWERTGHQHKGRDGCRVPLPWTSTGSSYGFGAGEPHLPQPAWFGDYAVDVQFGDLDSTLEFYRSALRIRRDLRTIEELAWEETDQADLVVFRRPGGWMCATNFAKTPAPLPPGQVIMASGPVTRAQLPGETTIWLLAESANDGNWDAG
jgi:alpha-glucosidase